MQVPNDDDGGDDDDDGDDDEDNNDGDDDNDDAEDDDADEPESGILRDSWKAGRKGSRGGSKRGHEGLLIRIPEGDTAGS